MAASSFDPQNPKLGPAANSGGIPKIVYGAYEKTSTSFKAGQFVFMDGSGAVDDVADNGVSVYGIALADSTNTSSASAVVAIPVMTINPGDELLIKTENSGAAALANTGDIGDAYSLNLTSGLITVDFADNSTPAVIFNGPVLDATGASTYWGRFHLIDTVAQAVSG